MDYYQELIGELLKRHHSKDEIAKLKISLCRKHKMLDIPTDIEVLLHAKADQLERLSSLQSKPTRTISGVSVLAVMTRPVGCPHGKCTMCPGGPNSIYGDVPQSYTGNEPASMRAIRNDFDPYLQIFNRLEQYVILGHDFDKAEIIIMGGTFPALPKTYQRRFVKYLFKAMNDFSDQFIRDGELDVQKFREFFELPGERDDRERAKRIKEKILALKGEADLEKEHARNETSGVRCVGLTIETKPDWGFLEHGNEMLELGCTRVELGVQTDDDDILQKINRGHTIDDTYRSIRELRDLGFKLNFHLMPGLPGSDKKKDIEMLRNMFTEKFQPDMVKVYPCMVMPGTKLYDDWKKGEFVPITTEQAAEIISEFYRHVPPHCRVMRVQRDIPTKVTSAGVDKTNLRQYVDRKLKEKGIVAGDIRAREVKKRKIGDVTINAQEYLAAGGKELFISADDERSLIGFCRMRYPSAQLREEITTDSALIRELHVYGQAIAIGSEGDVQHKGFGRQLLEKAEDIAKKDGKTKMVVISGVGVREYYRKLGYKREGPYMVKRL